MKFFAGLIFGFISGTFYALYQTVEAPDGMAVQVMEKIKLILEVF
jgi:hypothetical protein